MPGCVFSAVGDFFNVEEYLATVSMDTLDVFIKGQQRSRRRPRASRPFKASGFTIGVSDSNDVKKQIDDALKFISRETSALLKLKEWAGVTERRLDFGCTLSIGKIDPSSGGEIMVQCEYFPAALLKIAGDLGIGIEVSIYPALEG